MTRTSKYELSGECLAEFTKGRLVCGAGLYVSAGASIDTRTLVTGQVYFSIVGPRFDGHDFVEMACDRGAAGIVVDEAHVSSPAVQRLVVSGRCFIVAVEDTTAALIAAATSWISILAPKVIAITGSVGKTTTRSLTCAAVSSAFSTHGTTRNFNNRLGVALTCLALKPSHEVLVIEMGMNAPGEIAELCRIVRPDIAIVTIVAPVHLEGLKSIEGVAAAKAELIEALKPDGVAVLNADDPLVAAMCAKTAAGIRWFGRSERADVRLMSASVNPDGTTRATFAVMGREYGVTMKIVGTHNAMNAAAAVAAAIALGVEPEAACRALQTVGPAHHRMELSDLGTIRMIDDCYNASPRSVIAALDTLAALAPQRRRVAVLGDMLEMGDATEEVHRQVGASAAGHGVNLLVAVGRNAAVMAGAALEAGMPQSGVYEAQDALAAAAITREMLLPRDVVLVKGSRGVGLELVTDAIRARFEVRDLEAGN